MSPESLLEYVRNRSWKRSRLAEKFWTWLAWRIPRRLAYWATIRVGVNATTGEYSDQVVPELPYVDALKRWQT